MGNFIYMELYIGLLNKLVSLKTGDTHTSITTPTFVPVPSYARTLLSVPAVSTSLPGSS